MAERWIWIVTAILVAFASAKLLGVYQRWRLERAAHRVDAAHAAPDPESTPMIVSQMRRRRTARALGRSLQYAALALGVGSVAGGWFGAFLMLVALVAFLFGGVIRRMRPAHRDIELAAAQAMSYVRSGGLAIPFHLYLRSFDSSDTDLIDPALVARTRRHPVDLLEWVLLEVLAFLVRVGFTALFGRARMLFDGGFVDDEFRAVSVETLLTSSLQPIFVIGAPQEGPLTEPSTVHAVYTPDGAWFETFRVLAKQAKTIFINPGTSTGLLRELKWLRSESLVDKCVFIRAPGLDDHVWTRRADALLDIGIRLPTTGAGALFRVSSAGDVTTAPVEYASPAILRRSLRLLDDRTSA